MMNALVAHDKLVVGTHSPHSSHVTKISEARNGVRRRRDSNDHMSAIGNWNSHSWNDELHKNYEPVSTSPSSSLNVASFIISTEAKLFRTPLFTLFASLDEPCLDEFLPMYAAHRNILMPLLDKLDDAVRAIVPTWTLLSWLEGDIYLPGEAHNAALITCPLTTIFQLSSFMITWKVLARISGEEIPFERFIQALSSGGFITHGRGVFAALAVASSSDFESFIQNSIIAVRSSMYAGIAYEANNEAICKDREYRNSSPLPKFLLHVVNIPLHSLEVLVDSVNDSSGLPEGTHVMSDVVISRILSPRAAVLCGHPLDICRMEKAIMDFSNQTGVKILKMKLNSHGPEFTDYYCRPLSKSLLNTWLDEGISYSGRDLMVEVFSPVNGKPLSRVSNLTEELSRICTYQQHNLICSLGYIKGPGNVIDLGPGTLSTRVGFFLRWMDSQSSVICAPQGISLPRQAPSPKRSTKKVTRESILSKCAVLNDLVHSMTWSGKPCGLGSTKFLNLQTSFQEIGLVKLVEGELTSPRIGPSIYPKFSVSRRDALLFTSPEGTVTVAQADPTFETLQHVNRFSLTPHAVAFVEALNEKTNCGHLGVTFPVFALLLCKDVAELIEYWDTLEFVAHRVALGRKTETTTIQRINQRKSRLLDTLRTLFP